MIKKFGELNFLTGKLVNWLTVETETLIERETAVQAKLCHEHIILGLGSLWSPVINSVNE